MSTTAGTRLSLERIKAEATKFGLGSEDFDALTIHEFHNGTVQIKIGRAHV